MNEDPIIKRIAIALISLSLIHTALWASLVGTTGIRNSIIGLVINLVLGYFLFAGHGWARWWTVIRCFFGGLLSFKLFITLGEMGVSAFSILRLWLLFTVVVTSSIGAYLCFSSRVSKYYHPRSMW